MFVTLLVIAGLLGLGIAYIIWCLETVGSEENAAVRRFGKLVRKGHPGLNFLLKPFESIQKDPKEVVQIEISHKSDLNLGPPRVYATEEEEREDRIRVVFQNAESATYWDDNGIKARKWDELTPAEKEQVLKDPFNKRRVTAEFSIILRFQIREESYFDFIENIGSIENARSQIADTAVTTIRDQLARVTYGHANIKTEVFAKLGRNAVEKLIGDAPASEYREDEEMPKGWGIDLLNLDIKGFELGHTLNSAQAELVAADFQAEKIRQIGAAEGERIRLEGAGKAEAEELLLKARAMGTEALAKIMDTDEGELAARMTTIQRAIESSDHTTVLPGDMAFLGGLREILSKPGEKKE